MTSTALTEADKAKLYKSSPVVSEIGEIRVLQLLEGLRAEPLRCRLLKTSISKNYGVKRVRPYEALSYTWGEGDYSTLVLNDKPGFEVTTNLAAALRRLRHEHKPRTLWVDALCINQLDIQERNGQVKLMGDIFSNATGVLVWLGDVQKTNWMTPSDDCIVYQTLDGTTRRYRSPEVRPADSIDISATEMQRAALHGALHVTSPSWWQRTWVVQEFCKAPSNMQMCYGTFEETYDEFFSEAGLLWQLVAYNGQDGVCQSFWSAQYRLNAIRTKVREGPMTILDFVENCFQATATDARDKAYSLRSMISVDEAKWIEPDYYASIVAVFTRATFASIVGSGHLAILRYAWSTSSRDPTLPSWTVDFGDNSLLPGEAVRDQLRGLKLFETPEPWSYMPEYSAALHPSLDEDCGMLSLGGRLHDSVQLVGTFDACSLVQGELSYMDNAQARCIHSMLSRLLGPQRSQASAMLKDIYKHRSRTVLQYIIDAFQHWYHHTMPDITSWQGADEMLTDYALYSTTQGKADYSMFATNTGRLGFIRGRLQERDIVVLLHGAPMPAILRPNLAMTSTFHFVGFAVVASLMGEPGQQSIGGVDDDVYFAMV